MGAATLLNVIRLVIHAHFEPYIRPNDNLFEYLTLIITSLTGLGGLLLQGLETSKDYAMSKSDDVGKQAAEEQIKGVMMFLDVGVYCIIIVFSLFFANIMVGHNIQVRKVCAGLRHLCARPTDTEDGDGIRSVRQEGSTESLGWLQRASLRCRTRKGGNGGGGEAKGEVAAAGESSTEMTMLSNPSYRFAGGHDGGGGGGGNKEDLTAVAASRAAGGSSEGKTDTSSNAVGTTTGESKGCEAARGGMAARNQEFFQHQRKETGRVDAEAAQEKRAARSRLSPEARQEAEKTETAEEDRGRAKSHMIREQKRTHSAAGERGQRGARGGGVQSRNVDTIARSTSIVLE